MRLSNCNLPTNHWLIVISHPTKIIQQKNPSSKFHTEYTKPTNRLKGFMSRQETRPQTRAPKQLNPSNDWANLFWIEASFTISCVEVVFFFYMFFRHGNFIIYTLQKNRMLGTTKKYRGRYYLIFYASTCIYIYIWILEPPRPMFWHCGEWRHDKISSNPSAFFMWQCCACNVFWFDLGS